MDTSMWGHPSEAPSNLSLPQAGATSAPTALNPELRGSCSSSPFHEESEPFGRSPLSKAPSSDMAEELQSSTHT